MTFIGAALVACLSASAQLVYVKCCVNEDYARYCFGPMMSGPRPINNPPPNWRLCRVPGPKCIYGFGPGPTSVALQEAMCNQYYPDNMPDQTDCVCSEWQDDSIEIIDLCWQWGGSAGRYDVIYDYDGDGDLDLRDYARFQNEFSQRTESPKRPGRGRPERSLAD